MEKINYKDGDKDRFFLLRKPGAKILSDAKIESSKLFAKIVKSDDTVIFRNQLDEYMIKHGLMNEETARKIIEIAQKISEKQQMLESGGIKLSDARKAAIDLRKLRNEYINLSFARTQLDSNTVEGQVENYNFDYIVINCILDEDGNRVFNDIYEYRDDSRTAVFEAANKLASIIYGIDESPERDFPENKFLLQYGFVNENLELVDKEGNSVDEDGNPYEEEKEIEFKPFLDEDGNEIVDEVEEVDKEEEKQEVE